MLIWEPFTYCNIRLSKPTGYWCQNLLPYMSVRTSCSIPKTSWSNPHNSTKPPTVSVTKIPWISMTKLCTRKHKTVRSILLLVDIDFQFSDKFNIILSHQIIYQTELNYWILSLPVLGMFINRFEVKNYFLAHTLLPTSQSLFSCSLDSEQWNKCIWECTR